MRIKFKEIDRVVEYMHGGITSESKSIFRSFQRFLNHNRIGELLVLRGIINPSQLRSALKEHKSTKTPLGQVFIAKQMISRWQLRRLLVRQYALRCLAASLFFFVSFSNFSVKKANANDIGDIPAQMSLIEPFADAVSANAISYETKRMTAYPSIFGTAEKKSHNLKAFTKWTGMFKRFEKDLDQNMRQSVVHEWKENLEDFRNLPMKKMAAYVNDYINEKPYVLDSENWDKSDYWATPIEFMERGGDCEDFAIAKYAALRALGIPEERLRILIVEDTKKQIPHAVLTVYTDQGAFILDNQIKTLVNVEVGERYKPIFSINRDAWWLHSAPSGTVLASAE